MHLSSILFSVACVSSAAAAATKPEVYNTTLRNAMFHGNAKELNQTIKREFESLQNDQTTREHAHSMLPPILAHFKRTHNITLDETVLLNGTHVTLLQMETAMNAIADIRYVHNSTKFDTLSSPAVHNFSASLSKSDKKAFAKLLAEQKEMTKSPIEAFSGYPTTTAFVDCVSSCNNLEAFNLCRQASYSSDQSLIALDARLARLNKTYLRCFAVNMISALVGVLAILANWAIPALFFVTISFVSVATASVGFGCMTGVLIAKNMHIE